MARRSLKPQLNQIRTWVRQGRTNAWIAHQLQVSVKDIDAFKREHDLAPATEGGDGDAAAFDPLDEAVDLRAEDDALVAAELDAESAAEDAEEEEEDEEEDEEEAGDDRPGAAAARSQRTQAADGDSDEEGARTTRRRRRGRRGGRGRRRQRG